MQIVTIPVKFMLVDPAAGQVPQYQTAGAAGMDLVAAHDEVIGQGRTAVIKTGIQVAVPIGYEMQVRSRGGLASKGIFVTNGPGTVDSDYRGEVMVLLTNLSGEDYSVKRGDRIAQAVFAPYVTAELEMVWDEEDLGSTARGHGRFASTGY